MIKMKTSKFLIIKKLHKFNIISFSFKSNPKNNELSNEEIMEYKYLIDKVFKMKPFQEKKLRTLDEMKKACKYFDVKCDNKYIHVGGTNGKGSVCRKIETALRMSGLKTGLYTSPHICSAIERIVVDNTYCEIRFINEFLKSVFKAMDQNIISLSFFEIFTILMFKYFERERVDVGLIEVGVGGENCPTNVMNPLMSIITSIDYDHMHLLGNTKKEIATVKSGIIKYKKPAIIGYNCEPKEVFIEKAKTNNSDLKFVETDAEDFDNENSLTAKLALETFRSKYDKEILKGRLTDDIIIKSLEARPNCRIEDVYLSLRDSFNFSITNNLYFKEKLCNSDVKIILDVAHNEDGIRKLLRKIVNQYPKYSIKIIMALSASKDTVKMIDIFEKSENVKSINFAYSKTEFNKLLNIDDIFRTVKFNEKVKYVGDINETIKNTISELEKSDKEIILITGSFYIMKEARKLLGYNEFIDP